MEARLGSQRSRCVAQGKKTHLPGESLGLRHMWLHDVRLGNKDWMITLDAFLLAETARIPHIFYTRALLT